MRLMHRHPHWGNTLLSLLLVSCAVASPGRSESEDAQPAQQSSAGMAAAPAVGAEPESASAGSQPMAWPSINPSQSLAFDRWSIDEGLSQSSPNVLLQDQAGFVWIGTEDGLNRFDGYDFVVYRANPANPQSLSNSYVTALAQSPDGTLWVGTYGGGLDRYDPTTGQFRNYRPDPNDPTSLSDDKVMALQVDRGGALWIGTLGGGLDRLEPGGEGFLHYRHAPGIPGSLGHDYVSAILLDRSGALWVGGSRGLDRLEAGASEFEHYRHNPQDPDSMPPGTVLTLFQDSSDRLWIGMAGGGLARYRPATDDFAQYRHRMDDPRSLSSDVVYAIAQDPTGWLWLGTEVGLDRFDPSTGRFQRYAHDPTDIHGLAPGQVRSLLLDQSGGLWAGSYGGGLSRLDPRRLAFAHYRARPGDANSLSRPVVWSIYQDRVGILWIGTGGGGLDRFDRKAGLWSHYRHDPSDPTSLGSDDVRAIYQDRYGALWVGTAGGGLHRLNRFERNFERFQHDPQDPGSLSDNVVWFIDEDRQGSLWVGTASGLNRFDRATGDFQRYQHDPQDPYSLADSNTGSFYQDRAGRYWIGTHEAFHRFDPDSGRFTRYQHDPADPTSISHNIVFSIHEDQAGMLWLGTWGGGLNRLDPETERFTQYRMRDGLPNDVIYGILEDEQGRLWMSTNGGISCFDPEFEVFTNFDVADGLQSNEFAYNAYFEGSTGELFFGGINGFNAFFPADLAPSPIPPMVMLTSLTHDGQPAELGPTSQSLVLEWPGNSLDFEFAALTFYQTDENQYAYRLDGFDQDWNYVEKRRFGRYTNLPGGEYTLRVKAANRAGIWNETGVSIPITVMPPLWATWWFRGLSLLLLGAVGFGIYRFRVSRVEAHSRALEAQIHERTRTLEQRSRDLERRRKELEALYRADEELLSRLDLDAVLQALVDTAVDILEADKGGVLVWDPRQQLLSMRASKGFQPSTLERMRFAPGQGLAGTVFASGVPVAVEDAAHDPRTTKAIVEPEGIRALLQVPIKVGKEIYGVFSADYTRPRRFDDETKKLLIALASHAAMAIENARLFEAEQRRVEQMRMLNAMGSRVTSIMAVDELLCEFVNLIRDSFNYYLVEIGLVEGDELVYRAGAGGNWGGNFRSFRLQVGKEGITGLVAATGKPMIVPDLRIEPRYVRVSAMDSLSELAVPIKARDTVIGVFNVESDQLSAFDESDLVVFQSLADQAAIAIENARLYEAEQRRGDQFQVLLDVGGHLTSILSPDEVRDRISNLVREHLGYNQVSIGLIEGEDVVYRSGAGQFWDLLSREPLRLKIGGHSLSSWVVKHGEPLLVPDVRRDARYFFLPGDTETKSELVVPLRIKETVIGVLAVSSDRLDDFDQSDVAVLQSLADQSAIAIENARLYAQAGEAAATEERTRLARDLHDAVTQTLFSASLIAEALPSVWEEDRQEGGKLLQELRQLNRGALAEMRSLLMELRPAALEEAWLGDLMRQLGAAVSGRSGLAVDVRSEGECELPRDVHLALYRIAQEALNNVVKHAGASHVEVALSCIPAPERTPQGDGPRGCVELTVADNGSGFDPLAVAPESLGLEIIRERARTVGALLNIESKRGEGTTVVVRWEG